MELRNLMYDCPWHYEGDVFDPLEDYLKQYVGFVYLIVDNANDKKYIGKKFFWSTKKLPPLKGKTRKRTKTVQSDWKKYFGSSEHLKDAVNEHGLDLFERHMLRLCYTKTECAYYELKEQMDRDVLLKHEYYNNFVGGKINGNNLLKE